ncbi:MAG: cytochrome c biogenesis protein CcsA [Candidatus Kapabacteria bacterium]|nr:cytochrome c biogenesis protein CcsA [Ignavibacteriota bacterium]MCW5885578.1 cytochrome c biogenesis protein CcsA [Candidatus Kapabacteria bacterium]
MKEGYYESLNISINVRKDQFVYDEVNKFWIKGLGDADIKSGENLKYNRKLIIRSENLPEEFKAANKLVIKAKYNKDFDALEYIGTKFINPPFDYPFVPNLDERIKILNLHVPMAWIAVVAYLMSMIYAIMYLRTNDLKWDIYNASTASLGNLFAILATVTGMLWAKYNWGSYWNWDPRQTSIFILIMIYAAFFALRAAIDSEDRRAKLSSVYSIISFVTVPFLVFVLPRLATGLHPGSKDDVNAGPLVSAQPNALDTNMLWSFGLSLFAFTVIYFWILNMLMRTNKINHKIS